MIPFQYARKDINLQFSFETIEQSQYKPNREAAYRC